MFFLQCGIPHPINFKIQIYVKVYLNKNLFNASTFARSEL